jgi:hypothetical protein
MAEHLTNYRVKNLRTKSKQYKIYDDCRKGLFVLVYPSGTKTWRMKYRIGTKEKAFVLGTYPELSVKQARELCFDEYKQIQKGIDISKARKLDKQRIHEEVLISFKDVSLAWIEDKKKDNEQKGKDAFGRFKNYVFPVFKDIPIKEVKTTHLEDLLRDIQTEYNIHETPRRLRQDFINVFKYAYSIHTLSCYSRYMDKKEAYSGDYK